MSTTIDSKVVEMRFDNKQFEAGAQTSLSTLEKLKQSLNLKGASKGLEEVGATAKKTDFGPLGRAVENVGVKFSALQVVGVTALTNITNSAVNAGKRIVSALTIDPIKTGFSEYETKINAVQTIMSNTASKGVTMADVTRVLGELNTYADKTIYNFAEMTRNIGTFTAAGVGLEESAQAIQGIANLAAVSGSNSQQASTAMYQLSQAMAAGTVKLMDWNSVVNAGMGGQVFQDALKATARAHGVAVDQIIEKNGSFRESLQEGWITTEILTETLSKMTKSGAAEYLSKLTGVEQSQIKAAQELVANNKDGKASYDELAETLASTGKISKEEALNILKMADNAEDAATKVKTFTQLWDTLKESAQSGWAQSWEIVVGDFEEAKEFLTEISDAIGGLLNNSAEARNKVLQDWKDLGGRTAIIEGLRNVFEGLMSIAKPIKEAFRDIFPAITAEQLLKISEGFKNLTEKLIIGEDTAKKIKTAFKGVFSAMDIGVELIKAIVGGVASLIQIFSGLEGGILTSASLLGDWVTNLRNGIVEGNVFGNIISNITKFLSEIINGIKKFVTVSNDVDTSSYEGLFGILKAIWDLIIQIGSKIGQLFSELGSGLSEALGGSNFFDTLNDGLFAGILLGINKFVHGASNPLESIADILDDVRGCFQAYQEQLKASTLMKIASAIGILAASIFVISTIDGDSLARSLGAITVLFAELLGSLSLFGKLDTAFKKTAKAISVMIGMSIAISILSGALKKISSIDTNGLIKGLIAIGVLMLELSLFLNNIKMDGKITKNAVGIVLISTALVILSKAVENFGDMNWKEIGKGLTAIGGLLVELAIFTNLTSNTSKVVSTGASMILLGAAMKIFASAMKDFSGMNWKEIGKGLAAMGGALAEIIIAMSLVPKNIISKSIGLIAVGAAMKILASSLTDFSGMSWNEIGKGLTAMGGALVELAIGLHLMKGTLSGSMALVVAAGALLMIVPAMTKLGNMSWSEIGKGLVALAGAFTVVGIAGLVLGPLIPTILGLSAAFALFGVAMLGIGAGVALVSTAFAALAGVTVAGATSIVAALSVIVVGIANLIPTIIEKIGEGVVALCVLLGECAPLLADSALKLISEVLASCVEYIPQIANSLIDLVIGILEVVATRLPEIIVVAMQLIGSFFQGVVDALNSLDTTTLVQGIVGVGLISALIVALSMIVGFIPGAMAGVLGMGAVVVELAAVLAAIGALAQIPGLEWLISEGGQFLQTVGTAIGKFMGGIVGGFAEGVSSSFPQIGSDLSAFMTNAKPFIEGARSIDASMMEGVESLTKTILMLTAADILNGVTSWITGGSSMTDFASQLVPFGNSMKAYSLAVAGMDTNAVTNSATAAKALSELANNLPNSGGIISWLTGENDISDFGNNLVPFGEGLKKYSDSIVGIDIGAINNSVSAAKTLSNLIKSVSSIKTDGVTSFKNAINNLAKTNVSGLVKAFSGSSGKLKNIGINIVSNIQNGIKSKQSTLNTTASSVVASVVKILQSKTGVFRNSGVQLANALTQGFSARRSAVTTNVNNVIMNTLKIINSKKTAFRSAGLQLFTQFLSGLTTQKNKANNTMKDTLRSMDRVIDGYYTTFYNSGLYLVRGFANGIKLNTYISNEAARKMASRAAEAAKKELDEHSPSKVFYIIGKFVVEGFANAIKDGDGKVITAISSMTNTATKNLTKGVTTAGKKLKNTVTAKIIAPITKSISKGLEPFTGKIKTLAKNVLGISTTTNAEMIKNQDTYWAYLMKSSEAEEEALSKLAKFKQDILDKSTDSISKYTDEIERNTDALMNNSSLFDEVSVKDPVSGSTLLKNLSGQVDELEEFDGIKDSLEKKLSGSKLWEYLSTLGVDNIAELKALNELSEEDLDKYKKLYEKKYKIASDIAKEQSKDVKKEVEAELSDLFGGIDVDLDKLLEKWDGTWEGLEKYLLTKLDDKDLKKFKTNLKEMITSDLTEVFKDSESSIDFTKLLEKWDGSWDSLGSHMSSTLKDLKLSDSDLTKIKTYFSELGIDLGEEVSTGISETAKTEVDKTTKKVTDTVSTSVSDSFAKTDFSSAAKSFCEALLAAFKNYNAKFKEAGSGLAKSVLEGFVCSINIENDSDFAILDAIENTIDKIEAIINSDVELVPRIRPVLDMSSMQNQMSGLLNTPLDVSSYIRISDLSAGINEIQNGNKTGYDNIVSAINDMQSMNDSRNLEIVNAVNKLHNDIQSLSSAMSNIKITMNSGAVVGEIKNDMDQALGQMASLKGRGN